MRTFLSISFAGILLVGIAPTLQAAIYKTVDKEGNVLYTDVPPKQSSAPMDVDRGNTYIAAEAAADDATQFEALAETGDQQRAATSYSELSITAPSHDQAVRENAGNLAVTVASLPALDAALGHQVQILLDGQKAATGGARVSLTNIDRGTHSLTAQIIDTSGEVLISSAPVTFHMLRYSRLMKKSAARAAN